ncbi:ABC transporter ATP-binding protein [Halopiger aswanensis]|uniref:ABC-type D-xylose/L-arabinose transporter n=1 Tax=Halopiger aswanensis TaxID=148449 RepID=A0A419VVR2_9EURY|nr:sn-glycerol-3-phosphate ABC transporter ATP-binding protein UgpC [Halopiger aswanensis]RKD86259.1 multiple sugar transport system ATP-binding protein [Halopiger aswanensis]
MAQTTIDGVTKRFDSGDDTIVAVDDLSIDIRDGEFLVLVGPSGCGKSTTLRTIAGLETVSEGNIYIGDRDVTDVKPKDRDIAMVFQNYALYPQKTVAGNMRFGLKMTTDLDDEEITRRVEEAAELLDISELLDRRPRALSGGQQQRVALGRAIVRDPAVFLMDEPLSNLDAKLRTQMRTELQELHDELEATTVYVTHDQTEAMTMGDRIAVLAGGELQQVGTPMEMYYEPANEFVATFIGSPSMNILEATFDGENIQLPGFTYEPTDAQREALDRDLRGDSLTLGIRPEDVVLTEEPGPRTTEFTASIVEPMGNENVLHLDHELGEVVATVAGGQRVREGDRVRVTLPADHVHAFDGETGQTVFNRTRTEETATGVIGSRSNSGGNALTDGSGTGENR